MFTNFRKFLWVIQIYLLTFIFLTRAMNVEEKNINKLLNNQIVVSRQIMCVLEKSPCDQLGRQLKAALPEVILRNCRSCSPKQAQNAQKLTSFLQSRYPDVWDMLILTNYNFGMILNRVSYVNDVATLANKTSLNLMAIETK